MVAMINDQLPEPHYHTPEDFSVNDKTLLKAKIIELLLKLTDEERLEIFDKPFCRMCGTEKFIYPDDHYPPDYRGKYKPCYCARDD